MRSPSQWKKSKAGSLLDLNELVPVPWRDLLWNCRDEIYNISKRLAELNASGVRVLPRFEHVFSALELPAQMVRVVVVGQDPYPAPELPIGRAFAVPKDTRILPPSLRNILKERREDVGGSPPSPTLEEWSQQGVLLLNRVLTVSTGLPGSHSRLGWQSVTEQIARTVSERGAIGVLWGRSARELEHLFHKGVVVGIHPSPLSAHRGFFGSRPFSAVNSLLDTPITW